KSNAPRMRIIMRPTGDYAIVSNIEGGDLIVTPLPSALPPFTTGLGALGLLAWRRKQKACIGCLIKRPYRIAERPLQGGVSPCACWPIVDISTTAATLRFRG